MSTTRVRRGADVTLYTKSPKMISKTERHVFCSWDDQWTMTENPMVLENVTETREYTPIFDHQFLCSFIGPNGRIWDRLHSRFIEEPLWLSEGEEVFLAAVPDTNYSFIEWSDGVKEQERSIIIDKAFNLTAVFEEVKEINITYPEDSFTVTYDKKVTKGNPLTITIAEKEGNLRYYEKLVDSEGTEYTGTTIEIPAVEKNMNFDLQSLDPVNVTLTADSGIKFTSVVPTQVKAHSNLTVTVADDTKWFDYWSDQTSYTTKQEKTRTWTDITSSLTIQAKACDKYVIYFSSTAAFSVGMSYHTASCTSRRAKCEGYRSYETYAGETISAPANGKVYVYRELNGNQTTSAYDQFKLTGSAIKLNGSAWVQNLIGTSKTSIPDYAFYCMFFGQTALTSVPDSSYNMALGSGVFQSAFNQCTGLTTCPRITPTGSQVASYSVMRKAFYGCTGITGKGNNVFTNFSSYNSSGYQFYETFRGCTKLTANPSGWFTWNSSHMAKYAYAYMFQGCTGITRVGYNYFCEGGSQIGYNYTSSSSAGFDYCFYYMFQGCTALKSAYIWGGYFGSYSHAYMFNGCTSLTLLYVINGNSTYHTSGSHWNNMFTNVGSYAWIVFGKYGNSTSYSYTWQNLYDNTIINNNYVTALSMVATNQGYWSEVYDWYNWDSYGKSRHNNNAMKYTERPILSFGTSSSSSYCDMCKMSAGNSGTHYVYILPSHYTGWVNLWSVAGNTFRYSWYNFSTYVWAYKTITGNAEYASNVMILTDNKSGGRHWNSWAGALQSY